jgi:hypothetical protein
MKKAAKTSRPAAKAAAKAATKTARHAAASGRAPRPRDTMRAEYDFSAGVRGKYAKRFAAGSNVVVLEPELAAAFPTPRAVNAALRRQLAAAQEKRAGRGRSA